MSTIKFGTDGWRAIIADQYTLDNVSRVTEGTAAWMKENSMSKVVIGYDCRFGGKMFAERVAAVFAANEIHVILSDKFVSTPMVSLGVVKYQANMGVVITASHNPPSYNGYKLKSAYGGPTIPKDIAAVEAQIPEKWSTSCDTLANYIGQGLIEISDLETLYLDHVRANFDLEAMMQYETSIAYDAMYGAGQDAMRSLFPQATLLHCTYNPSFMGQAPEPIARNLEALSTTIKADDKLKIGIANDGDADRIGMYDEDGHFVDSHHILLLLLMYLYEYKDMSGKVVVTFSVTDKMKKLAEHYGLDFEVTKIGFKYIAEIMIEEDVLVGGEESGGLAVKGHIPERDGIWIGLTIMEFMAKTGKTVKELIQMLYDRVGSFAFDRDDLHISNELKWEIMDRCKAGTITHIGEEKIIKTENVDGYKFYISDDEWVMIRPSGTEPVLRVYAQGKNQESVRTLLDRTHSTLQGK